jgi:hypothetical protein
MSEREINHLIIALILNVLLVGLLIKKTWDGNDKAIVLVIFLYPLLILVNLIFWITLSSKRKPESRIYRAMTIALIILFLPVLIMATSF